MILEHVGITLRDLDRSISFYGEVLGFRVLRRTTTNAYLYLGEELVELIQAAPGAKGEPTRDAGTMERMLATIGPNHVGFRVDDLDASLAEIERRGGAVVTPPFDFTPEIEVVTETESEKLKRARAREARARGGSPSSRIWTGRCWNCWSADDKD